MLAGTHDLDTIKGPFTYDAQPPSEIVFKPLRAPDMTKVLLPLWDSYTQLCMVLLPLWDLYTQLFMVL